uniref:Phosphofurin acidic cluster sorting protein 2 n=1 Tax=Panagrolaimus sp. JU765 TaxID=591449 RepID=A0AC34RLQ3_9BILA
MDQTKFGSSSNSVFGNSAGSHVMSTIAAVPMKLYANWEVDRTSNSAIQRVFTMIISKIQISKLLKLDNNFIIGIRLQGHKRTLRSNDIVVPQNSLGNNIELNLDISFTIQYCHYLKRKTNIIQILIQRRKRYKNRHIPGFKTLAIGYLNLDDILQMGGIREVRIWDPTYLNKTDADFSESIAGTIFISNCQSQAIEAEGTHKAPGKEGILSDEDEDDTTEESDFEIENAEYGDNTPRFGQQTGGKQRARRARKKLNQKNIKSKLSALLKRFRAQDGSAGPSTGRLPPTAEELEEIFEELENISDSGPELEPDKVSIISNPKPGLRPFFGSKTDLPPIEDTLQSEESGPDTDDPEYSSDNENNQPFFLTRTEFPQTSTPLDSGRSHKIKSQNEKEPRTERSSSLKEKEKIVHSNTAGSVQSVGETHKTAIVNPPMIIKKFNEANMMAGVMNQLEDPNLFIASNIWICSSSDLNWISKIDSTTFHRVRLIDCPTRFRAQDGSAGPSTGRLPPTAEELEEIFEELENISDSGPELEPDKVSIISNPKPGLRPFFGSKTDLPPIEDTLQSEESGPDTDDPEYSSDNENNQPFFLTRTEFPQTSTPLDSGRSHKIKSQNEKEPRTERSSSLKEKEKIVHSNTAGSVQSVGETHKTAIVNPPMIIKKFNEANMMAGVMNQLEDPNLFIASNIWICSSSDLNWISKIDSTTFHRVRLIDCPTVNEVRVALQAIVARIQKFCNSNSESPPQTIIGILGADKLVTNILRIYVDLLQNKTTNDWLNYLRFSLLIPPNSVIGRTIALNSDSGLMEIQWKILNKINLNDTTLIEDCLLNSTNVEKLKALNIPIGEVMLQLHKNNGNSPDYNSEINGNAESQVFIPFIAEIHLGNLEELNLLHYVKKEEDEMMSTPRMASNIPSHIGNSMSPPTSPQMSKTNEWKELQIEYWTIGSNSHELPPGGSHFSLNPSNTPKSSSNGGKFSMKASVRTLSVAREPLSTLLSMLFVKERKKDKVLQKLGRKTKPRGSDTFNSQSRVVSSVTRMICNSKGSPLEVAIDGVTWNRVRFFQISAQWQTHVKFLPVSVPSSSSLR